MIALAFASILVAIPAGEFTMGRTKLSPDDKTGMRPRVLLDDRPARKVKVDAFSMDSHEVTNAEYAAFVVQTRRKPPYHWVDGKPPSGEELFPVFNVSWQDADAYCKHQGKRLPTEAEWERGARGGAEGFEYPWASDKIESKNARFNQTEPGPVGKYPPNAFGLYDMAGSVSEWCADWFDREYYSKAPAENPRGPESGSYKIIRGGAWSDPAKRVTVFFRNWVRPEQRGPNIGFRCVQ